MGSKSSKFEIYPIVKTGENCWNVSPAVLTDIWHHIEAQDKVKALFYDGHIKDSAGWINYLTGPNVFPLLVIDRKKQAVVHVAWLKDCFDGCCWAHHVSIGPYQRGAWEACREYWQQFRVIELLLGLTPATNARAVKFLQKICKFTVVGEIPYVCNMAYENRRVPGIISYYELQPREVRPAAAPEIDSGGQPWAAAEKAAAVEAAVPISM